MNTEIKCYGCEHHRAHIPDKFGDCREYCDTCFGELADRWEAIRRDLEHE